MESQYRELAVQYQTLADEAINDPQKMEENVEKMKVINARMAEILDSTIHGMTESGMEGELGKQRDELIQKLVRIQRDYNGLLINTDTLETLRRIRGFEESDWKKKLNLYFLIFLALAVVFFFILLIRRQKVVSTNTAPTSASSAPPLT
jgi:hypothetical protein